MIRTHHPHRGVAQITHAGLSGKTTEDRLALAAFHKASGQSVLLLVVSDGIGGHRAGEVAAELTVQQIVEEVSRSEGADPLQIMEAAIHSASGAIAERSASHADQAGMGSTCACAWVEGDRLFTSHVGDSRIYLVRDGSIRRITIDHTWVEEAIEKGIITSEQGLEHPNAHVLRRHLGGAALPCVDTRLRLEDTETDEKSRKNQCLRLDRSDIVLLCTDGLTDMVREDDILRVITNRSSLQSAAEVLVESANAHGGHDNITVVLIGAPQAGQVVRGFGDFVRRVIGAQDPRGGVSMHQDSASMQAISPSTLR